MTLDGERVELAEGAGKVQVVTFWATWCAPCLKELAHDYNKASSTAYGVHGIPHMVIVGKDGKILNVHRGYNDEALEPLVAEINAALAKP